MDLDPRRQGLVERETYTYVYALITRMTPALRWAAVTSMSMRVINLERRRQRTVPTDHNF